MKIFLFLVFLSFKSAAESGKDIEEIILKGGRVLDEAVSLQYEESINEKT